MERWSLFAALVVPSWMEHWAAVVGLIVGTAAAIEILRRGAQAVRRGWLALTKPWALAERLEDLIEEQECSNHRAPCEPPPKN